MANQFFPNETLGRKETVVSLLDVMGEVERLGKISDPNINDLQMLDWKSGSFPASQFDLDYKHQRGPDTDWIEEIHDDWIDACAAVIVCAMHPVTRRLQIVNGQQHIMALLSSYNKDAQKKVKIYTNYVVTDDPVVIMDMFLGANAKTQKLPEYDIYKNYRDSGRDAEVAIHEAVTNAGATVGPKKSQVSKCVTHMSNLYDAMTYDEGEAELVLGEMVTLWPKKTISTVTWGGLLEVRKEMRAAGIEETVLGTKFDEMLALCKKHFAYANQVQLDMIQAFRLRYPNTDTHKLSEKRIVCAGLVGLYNKMNPRKRIKLSKEVIPWPFTPATMSPKFPDLHQVYDKNTYHTYEIFAKICEDGNIIRAWAHTKAWSGEGDPPAKKYKATVDELMSIAVTECNTCPEEDRWPELEYGQGKHNNYTSKIPRPKYRQPEIDHKKPRAHPDWFEDNDGCKVDASGNRCESIENYEVKCGKCNLVKGSTHGKHDEKRQQTLAAQSAKDRGLSITDAKKDSDEQIEKVYS